jgi:imidazoleglycerol phosphate synthase glutamine amidotransferase subunit HisH
MNIDYAKTEYENSSIVAAIKLDNVFATQFHPEKSGLKGVSIFNNYL